jgi:hypothetical protein
MKTRTRLLIIPLLALASALVGFSLGTENAQSEPPAIIVDTPTAPHPKARIRSVDFEGGIVRFDWLNADGSAADSGDSIARFTVTGSSITSEQKQILATAITQATATP